ncbi:SDR family oxidoreductase [Candidatus Roizmanbacteria bacterium]|nr:SDR family oxidoreductase [Candidatus Roizmanbacteria bacterium]
MKILITGGAGFIGSHLSEYHLKKKDEVCVIDNLITGSKENIKKLLKNSQFHFYEEDLLTFDFSSEHSGLTFNFDIIYHLASPASPIQYKKYPVETLLVNSQGTHRLLEFMKKNNCKVFVLASTSEVYGDPQMHPQPESYWGNVNPYGVRSCYDEGKRFAEAITMTYFRNYHCDVRIARIFNTYGSNMEKQDGRVVSNFILQSLTNQPITIYGDGKQTRSFCYISDMVEGLYLLSTTPGISGEVINIGNTEEYTILELAQIIKKAVQADSPIIHTSIGEDDPNRRKPDISKAKKLLRWFPKISFEAGLEKTIMYFKSRFV